MPTSTRQILCEFIRADVGIRPYDADFNTSLNYNLKNQIWASCLQIIIKPTSVIAENYNLIKCIGGFEFKLLMHLTLFRMICLYVFYYPFYQNSNFVSSGRLLCSQNLLATR